MTWWTGKLSKVTMDSSDTEIPIFLYSYVYDYNAFSHTTNYEYTVALHTTHYEYTVNSNTTHFMVPYGERGKTGLLDTLWTRVLWVL